MPIFKNALLAVLFWGCLARCGYKAPPSPLLPQTQPRFAPPTPTPEDPQP